MGHPITLTSGELLAAVFRARCDSEYRFEVFRDLTRIGF